MSTATLRLSHILQQVLTSSCDAGTTDVEHGAIEAEINYHDPTKSHDHAFDGLAQIAKPMTITNGRGLAHSLDQDGFELTSIDLHLTKGIDLYDPDICREKMYPICHSVLRASFPECSKVVVFDHILRNPSRHSAAEQPDRSLAGGYAMMAHGDFTMRSGITRAQFELQAHETEQRVRAALGQRFAFVNVWVPLKMVERNPLAMLQWSSVAPRDVVTSTWHFPHRTGETYRVMHSDSHRWVYFPQMVPGECIVFKQFDSATDGRARIALHTAFEDPSSALTAPQRESLELRCIVFFGDLPDGFADNWPNVPDPIMGPDRVELGPISDSW